MDEDHGAPALGGGGPVVGLGHDVIDGGEDDRALVCVALAGDRSSVVIIAVGCAAHDVAAEEKAEGKEGQSSHRRMLVGDREARRRGPVRRLLLLRLLALAGARVVDGRAGAVGVARVEVGAFVVAADLFAGVVAVREALGRLAPGEAEDADQEAEASHDGEFSNWTGAAAMRWETSGPDISMWTPSRKR